MKHILDCRRTSFPLVVMAYEALTAQMPFLGRSLADVIGAEGDAFWTESEVRCREILHLCHDDVDRFRASVSAWVDFSIEYLQRQNRFLQTGDYACTSFEQIRQELYDNKERMEHFYLPALMFSFVFSANYIGYFQFFRREMVPRVQAARTICDIGCGHGVYLAQMLVAADGAFGYGFDISASSLATTRSLLQFHNVPATRYLLAEADLRGRLPVENATQDAVTCFEVIEHLDDPRHALLEIRRILRPDATLCLSTAVRMESVDHLFVFHHPDQLRTLVAETGFRVVRDDCFPLARPAVIDPNDRRVVEDSQESLGYVVLAV
jgi:2-polyprenyl-3-methyl-5-hydroxy-6-metoxy-1,4-benzoquinol methylase